MAAPGRIAGAKLHAVQSIAVVARGQIGAQIIDNMHDFAGADDFADFFRQLPQNFVGELGVVARQQAGVALEINMIGLHARFVQLACRSLRACVPSARWVGVNVMNTGQTQIATSEACIASITAAGTSP